MTTRLAVLLVAAAIVAPAARGAEPEPESQPPIVVNVTKDGFHWLDAGIGAGAVLAVVLLVIGLTLSVRQTNGRRGDT
jgi:hypothetical protein